MKVNVVMSIDRQDAGHAPLIPGAYERNTLSYREPGSMGADPSAAVPIGSSSLDAATIAEREREGGGGPSQRRRKIDMPPRTSPAITRASSNGSWLTGGSLWSQILRLARR